MLQPTFLHQRDEQRRSLRADERIGVVPMDGARISIAVNCRIGGDNADFVVARRCQRGFRTGGNHVQHRHIARLLTDFLPRHRRNRITRDNHRLNIVFQQKIDNLHGEMLNGRFRLRSIRHTRRIAEINDVFHRQPLHQRAHIGQTADS